MRKRLLLIDDDSEFVEMLSMRLEARGYDVAGASDGRSGLTEANAKKPDLILLDISMPDEDGFWALEELKKNTATRHVPVVMLTARRDIAAIQKAQDLGATDYFMKPCTSDDFLSLLERYTGPTYPAF
ncbi:MAG: response regulator [Candidatus Pacebacteria bacterium]|nr:response regulator [Candidatus Paceibacterota bacterium]